MARKKETVPPRSTPDRDSRYMGLAWIQAGFSKDPSTQVGAKIVAVGNIPLGDGYNGPPKQIPDERVNWSRPHKYDYIIHAEINAMNHSKRELLKGATLYVTHFPCKDCMIDIVASGIRRVVYTDPLVNHGSLVKNKKSRKASMKIADDAELPVDQFQGDLTWVTDWVEKMKSLNLFSMPDAAI